MNKKGGLTTIIILVAIILALAIGSIIFYKVFYEITEELKAVPEFSNRTTENLDVVQTATPKLLDFLIFFTFVSFFIGLIISSIYIDVNPAVSVVFIIFIIIAVILAGQISNVYYAFSSNSELVTSASEFPLTNMILGSYFPLIILIVGAIVIVILYGKSRRQGVGVGV